MPQSDRRRIKFSSPQKIKPPQKLVQKLKDYETLTEGLKEEILERRREENTERFRARQLASQQKVLLELAGMNEIHFGSALQRILSMAAKTLNVERVSFWAFNAARTEVICQDLYRLSLNAHESGAKLSAKDYPRYFAALENSRTLAATDAQRDARTAEFTEGYLVPLEIVSMMDVSVHLHGKMIGIICHEHIGVKREWAPEEQNFASSLADLTALAIETSERRRAEKELQQKTRELMRSNADLEQFAYVVSHDLKEPLQKIIGFSGLLKEEIRSSSDDKFKNYVEHIQKASESMGELIESVLALSLAPANVSAFQMTSLNRVVKKVLSDLEFKIREKKALIECGDLPEVYADESSIARVFLNLLSNALKFHAPHQSPVITIKASVIDGMAQVVIEDRGIGFDAKDATRLFSPFERLSHEERYEGHGVGLAICKKILERHHGQIRAESKAGKGARFIMTLPMRA